MFASSLREAYVGYVPVEDGVAQGWVDGRERVVEQVEAAPLVNCPGEAYPLLLAPAQVFAAAVNPRLKYSRVAFQETLSHV